MHGQTYTQTRKFLTFFISNFYNYLLKKVKLLYKNTIRSQIRTKLNQRKIKIKSKNQKHQCTLPVMHYYDIDAIEFNFKMSSHIYYLL